MGRYESIAVLERMADTKRLELELIESEIQRLREQAHKDATDFVADLREDEVIFNPQRIKNEQEKPVHTANSEGGGIRL